MTLNESKAYIKDLGLKTRKDYLNYWYTNKQECMRVGLPKYPDVYYQDKLPKFSEEEIRQIREIGKFMKPSGVARMYKTSVRVINGILKLTLNA